MKCLFMGSATGQGVAISHVTKRETYMKMVELQPGYGFGAQQFKSVSPGVTMYQISGTGAIVGVSVTGAKYYKDDALN